MKNISVVFLFLGALGFSQSGGEILKKVDERLTFDTDMSCRFEMVTHRAGRAPVLQEMRLFNRPKSIGGENKFLALVVRPQEDRGTGYLGIGDNFWIYDPVGRAFSHSTARENVQDSDVNNEDLGVANYFEDYEVEEMSEGKLGSIDVWVLELQAKKDSVAYDKIKLWVGKNDFLPYKEEAYSLSGTLMRTVLSPQWSKVGNRYIYNKVYFIDELKEGTRTVLTFSDVSLQSIPDQVFTRDYLERMSR